MFAIALNIPEESRLFFDSDLRIALKVLHTEMTYVLIHLKTDMINLNSLFPGKFYEVQWGTVPTLVLTIPEWEVEDPKSFLQELKGKMIRIPNLQVVGINVEKHQEEGDEEFSYLETYFVS